MSTISYDDWTAQSGLVQTGWTCATCGIFVCTGQTHECSYVYSSAVHEHFWVVAHVEHGVSDWAGGGSVTLPHDVVYLVCQCGATKRSVPE